ncbi:MAG: hypothetical protein ABIO05_00070, partial [Ferruginibacter sp.]
MNLNRYKFARFFESGGNNLIFNLVLTAFAFLFFPQKPGVIIIPMLLLLNTLWLVAYTMFNYLKNNHALVISE